MTREEALDILHHNWTRIDNPNYKEEELDEAFFIAIEALSADAVEVVRCRECEYWKCNPNTKNYGVCRKVSYDDFEVVMEKDDFCSYGFCSYGERREDGEA